MKEVFKYFTEESGLENSSRYLHWFSSSFDVSAFSGIDKFFACFLRYCSRLNILPKRKYLEAYIKIDAKEDIRRENIRIDSMSNYDYKETTQLEEAYTVLGQVALSTYDDYMTKEIEGDDFVVDMDAYLKDQSRDLVQDAMMKAYPALAEGQDSHVVADNLTRELNKISETYSRDKLNDLVYIHTDDSDKSRFICHTGIPAIDGDIGGIYSRKLYTLTGQPGSGKTRMALRHWVYPTLISAKSDVLFFELELSQSEVENILIAIHITQLYKGNIKIPDTLMNKVDGMSPEQEQIYEAAKFDLFKSGKYGKFIYTDELDAGTVEEKLRNEYISNNKLELICIDYMGIAEWKGSFRKEQYEIITEVYKCIRKFVKKSDTCALCINQYNDKGIEAAMNGKPIRSGHVQGGHVVQRDSDYDIAMTYTEEQKLAGVRMISSPKVRGASGFTDVMLQVDLSVSIFNQVNSGGTE